MTEADFDDQGELAPRTSRHVPVRVQSGLLPDYLGHRFSTSMRCELCGKGWGEIIHEGNIKKRSMVCQGKRA